MLIPMGLVMEIDAYAPTSSFRQGYYSVIIQDASEPEQNLIYSNHMKTIPFLLCICLGLLGVACSSSFKISSDYDKQVNFADYKTYKFTDETNSLPMTELNRRRLITAVSNALAAKGLSQSDNSDVLVNLQANIANKQ